MLGGWRLPRGSDVRFWLSLCKNSARVLLARFSLNSKNSRPNKNNILLKAYPLASGSSRYGPTGHYRFGGQTREIATKPWPCRDVSGRGRHTTSWATGANGISLNFYLTERILRRKGRCLIPERKTQEKFREAVARMLDLDYTGPGTDSIKFRRTPIQNSGGMNMRMFGLENFVNIRRDGRQKKAQKKKRG